jgi:hypothetical protein
MLGRSMLARFAVLGVAFVSLVALGYLGCRTDFSDVSAEAPSCALGTLPEGIGGSPPVCATCDACLDCAQDPCTFACDACGCECAGHCDGRSTCRGRCSENTSCDWVCDALGHCEFDCDRCRRAQFVCQGNAERCEVNCSGADECNVTCRSNSECILVSTDVQRTRVFCGPLTNVCTVLCTRTNCDVECESEQCQVNCSEGASCSLRTTPMAAPSLMCQSGTPKECPDGTLVCPPDRPCPEPGTGGAGGAGGSGGGGGSGGAGGA